MEKLKFKHLNRVSGILLYFSILKNNDFKKKKKIFLFHSTNPIANMAKEANIFS